MEQLKLTTIPSTLNEDSSDEGEEFMPSFDQPTNTQRVVDIRDDTTTPSPEPEDKELLLKTEANGSHMSNGPDDSEFLGVRSAPARRGSFKIEDIGGLVKKLAMACACTFGFGSHFAFHIMGPMKGILMERLNLTNTQFSLLIASLTLCNTVVPIVSGVLISRFGTTSSSIVVTSVILLGITIVTAASWSGTVWAMIAGFGVFGMGLAPLTVIQETIIVQFFRGHGLGFALAAGLTVGKLAGFAASVTAVPLSLMEPFTYRTPFVVATFACFVSWVMNIAYLLLLRHANNKSNQDGEGEAVHKVVEKKKVHWNAIFELSNMFWWYLVVVFLFGTSVVPFLHLSSNIIKHRFDTTDLLAAWDTSLILLLPVIVYPFLGLFLDKFGKRCSILLAAAMAVLLTYLLLLLPPHFIHPFPPILFFSIAFSLAPLTIVSLVPLLTKHVSTGLGLCKSLENIGSTLSQTVAGLVLDAHADGDTDDLEDGHENDDLVALRMFAVLGFLMVLACVVFLWGDAKHENGRINSTDDGSSHHDTSVYDQVRSEERSIAMLEDDAGYAKAAIHQRWWRSTVYVSLMIVLLGVCWLLFGVVAFMKAGVHAAPRKPALFLRTL